MKLFRHLPVIIFLLAIGLLGYSVQQSEFGLIFSFFTMAFGTYAYILYKKESTYSLTYLLGLAIIARIILIPSFPALSDDIYRFYWDAWVFDNGLSPFAYYPNELQHLIQSGEIEDTFNSLNSPNYYSVYPPFLQWIFRLAYAWSSSLAGFAISLKIITLIAEGLTFWFVYLTLKNLRISAHWIAIYALNPLIIIELTGNLHPESFMICGLSLLLFGLSSLRLAISAGWGMAIAAKLQPLLLAPLVFFHALKKTNKLLAALSGVLIGGISLSSLFLHAEWMMNFIESLQLYYQTFEFNGSIYKLSRWLGYQFTGYNIIQYAGPVLSAIAIALILAISLNYYSKSHHDDYRSLFLHMALAWMVYLAFSTTVHPWYVAPLILFAVFIQLESVLIWSYLICLSYISYSYTSVYEPLWLPFIQYLPVLALLVLDIRSHKNT